MDLKIEQAMQKRARLKLQTQQWLIKHFRRSSLTFTMLLRCSNLDASLEARAAVGRNGNVIIKQCNLPVIIQASHINDTHTHTCNEQNKKNSISYAASINVMMRLCVNRDSTGNNNIIYLSLHSDQHAILTDI